MDSKALYQVTVKEAYPPLRLEETLDTMVGVRWFSTLDTKDE